MADENQERPRPGGHIARTLGISPGDPAATHTAEADVPLEWRVRGVILDLYEVKQIHEGGGMGLVYRVHHRGWNIDLAVKSPRAKYFQTEQQKETFVRECETWVNLGLHPHIVSCHYVRILGGIPRVFAEYVEGGSLKDWIASRRLYEGGSEVALRRILDIAIQFAWGLAYAHEKGLVHQDVKPANVLMAPEGIAKVADFGLAKARAATGEHGSFGGSDQSILVSSGGMTPAYCSPEQASRQPLSPKTDIWSWGLSVLEMFAGKPFWAENVPEGMTVGQLAPEALEQYVASEVEGTKGIAIPPSVAELLNQCFQRGPSDRPKDMHEVAQSLTTLYQQYTGQDYPRQEPKAAELLADGLNNKALSLLDLGSRDQADTLLGEAIRLEPFHPEVTYNVGLLLWRSGRATDDALLSTLDECRRERPEDWRPGWLMGLVHMDRGDADSAVRELEEALSRSGRDARVVAALGAVKRGQGRWRRCLWTLEGHTGAVLSAAISPDGRWGLSGGFDNTVRLWELVTGTCLRTLEGHTSHVDSVGFISGGRQGLSSSDDKTVREWDLATGLCLNTIDGQGLPDHSLAISPDGRWALTPGSYGRFAMLMDYDRTLVLLWDKARSKVVHELRGHWKEVISVAISPDGRWGLSGGKDHTLRLWDLATGVCLRTFEGHKGPVACMAFSSDAHRVLSGSEDRSVRLWDVTTGECLRTFGGHTDAVRCVAFSPNGQQGLSGGNDTTLRLWNLTGGVTASLMPSRPMGHADVSQNVAAFRTKLAAASAALDDGEPRLALAIVEEARQIPGCLRSHLALDLRARAGLYGRAVGISSAWCLRTLEGHAGDVFSVVISADGHWGLSGSRDQTVKLWDLTTGACVKTFQEDAWVLGVAMSPDAHWGLSASVPDPPFACGHRIPSDCRWRLAHSEAGWVGLYDLPSSAGLPSFDGHVGAVLSVTISNDGRLGLSGSGGLDKTLRLWEVPSGRCFRVFEGHTSFVRSVAISQDGRWGLSGGDDKTVRLWEVSTGLCLRTFEGHTNAVNSVVLSSDSRWGLSGSDDKTFRVWDISSGRCLRTFEVRTSAVASVAVFPDCHWAISAGGAFGAMGGDDTVPLRLWDLATGTCLRTLEGHTLEAQSVAISSDGRWVLSGSSDKTVRLWEIVWEYEFPDAADWDEAARPYLVSFLTVHTPYAAALPEGRSPSADEVALALTRRGRPTWTDDDFHGLIRTLQCSGYGWLRPEGVRKKLEEMAAGWQGPPPVPWENAPEVRQ